MKETWRWFGPQDPVSLPQVKQAGATGIVTALHHLYRGEPWPLDDVRQRKQEIESAGLAWSVVESIPIQNSIKLNRPEARVHIGAWKDSLVALAKAGVSTICYNFMPLVDWTRTDLKWLLPSTGYALRFDAVDFAVYDCLMLQRKGAESQYRPDQLAAARSRFTAMPESRRDELERTIIAGLPGAEASYDRESFRRQLAEYEGVTPADLRSNLIAFLREVVPVAQDLRLRLCIHPDDPPWSLFGLPRVLSTAEDVRRIFAAVDAQENGLTFCVGSFGARADNDLVAMVREFASRIHFVHLRQVRREADGSFYEAEHLDGSSDMVGVIRVVLEEELRRRREGRADYEIPMRPDHGHLLADDIQKKVNPGYSLVGRLKGLAELRGVSRGLLCAFPELSN
ncbi:MAG TPA: mannonate dehydratase [Candidatus Acidoferrum sp.]|nr:mannonate dehydratase [Candidatus Acidoferrum sp.]